MRPDPSEFKDFTPAQIKSYLALHRNVQAAFLMKAIVGIFVITVFSALLAAFWKNEYAFASIMTIFDSVLGAIMWRIAIFYFPIKSG